jgi:hypothetical protein
MTADQALQASLHGRLGWVCRACGLIGDTRVVVHTDTARRLKGLDCRCGNRLVTFDPPELRVPFGRTRGLPLQHAPVDTLWWLHGLPPSPYLAAAVCARLGCPQPHLLSWSDWYARGPAPPKRRLTRPRPRFGPDATQRAPQPPGRTIDPEARG